MAKRSEDVARQLKVFSTPAGFVNAVVAAPSQKAALEAWGVHENLFANGRATVVTDPELVARALKTPGEIVRVPVGSADAILKGAKRPPQAAAAPINRLKAVAASRGKAPPAPPPPPKPDRGPLTRAERVLAEAESRRSEELAQLEEEQRALEARRRDREAELDRDVAAARRAREAVERRYRKAGGVD